MPNFYLSPNVLQWRSKKWVAQDCRCSFEGRNHQKPSDRENAQCKVGALDLQVNVSIKSFKDYTVWIALLVRGTLPILWVLKPTAKILKRSIATTIFQARLLISDTVASIGMYRNLNNKASYRCLTKIYSLMCWALNQISKHKRNVITSKWPHVTAPPRLYRQLRPHITWEL